MEKYYNFIFIKISSLVTGLLGHSKSFRSQCSCFTEVKLLIAHYKT
jgi:hypothetical protein